MKEVMLVLPYDSFLIDGPWLLSIGWLLGKITRRFVPDENRRRKINRALSLTTLASFYATSISLYFNLEWTRWIWEMCKADSGRDWMINSGVFHFDHENVTPAGHAVSAAIFSTYPVWLKAGFMLEEKGDAMPYEEQV